MTEVAELADLVSRHVDADEVVDICRRLVRVPSENPPGDERDVAAETERILSEAGLPSERFEPTPNRVSILSSWGGGDGRTLAFNGHYDVVPALDHDEWPHPPYGAVVDEGRIYGRGSSDMKAGIAACIAAVSGMRRAGLRPKGRLVMQFVADEEALGTHGARALVEHGRCAGIDEAVVGEPTALHLVTAERGAYWARITTRGASAHGSTPQLGVSAIEHMARVVTGLRTMRWRKLHDLLGGPTLNVGTIRGGAKANMVPDFCEIEIDRRTLPSETLDEVRGEIQALLDELAGEVPGFSASVRDAGWADASETAEGTTIVALLSDARDALGVDGSEIGYQGATDARFLINQGRIPTVIFGPGDLRAAHTTGESVELDQLVAGARVYAHAFARFLDAS